MTNPAPAIRAEAAARLGGRWIVNVPDGAPGQSVSLDVSKLGRYAGAVVAQVRTGSPLAGVNQIANSDFAHGAKHWRVKHSMGLRVQFGVDCAPEWRLSDGHTAFVQQPGAERRGAAIATYHDPDLGDRLPVVGGQAYRFSGFFGLHRCGFALRLSWLDSDGGELRVDEQSLGAGGQGGRSIEDYTFVEITEIAPPNAAFARLSVVKLDTAEGQDSFLFFTRLFFGETDAANSRGWSPRPDVSKKDFARLRDFAAQGAAWASVEPPDRTGAAPSPQSEATLGDVALYDTETGAAVDLAEAEPTAPGEPIEGEIEAVDGVFVQGWARGRQTQGQARLRLSIDGEDAGGAVADRAHAKGPYGFQFRAPERFCDGEPHLIEVRSADDARLLARDQVFFDIAITPWSALQSYSRAKSGRRLAGAASARYEALSKAMAELAQTPEGAAFEAGQIAYAHDVLAAGPEALRNPRPLTFHPVEAPDVSVIVPCHNKFAYTYACLCALVFARCEASFEVVLVDDGSSDETTTIEDLVSGLIVVRHEAAQGFVRACNAGAAQARGRYLVFLNNDTEPVTGWLDELIYGLERFDRVGMTGAKLVYPDGRLQEAGGIVWGDGDPWNYGRNANPEDPRYTYTREVDYLSGAAICLPRAVWDDVGGFDLDFAPAYFEDTDLAFRVRDKGYRTVLTPHALVYHIEGVSSGTSTASGMKKYQEINRPKFKRRWQRAYSSHGKQGDQPDLEKDRGALYRALFLDTQFPRPDRDAGSYAAVQEIRLLQALGFKATLAVENVAYLGDYTHDLQRIGVETLYAPFFYSVEEVLEKRGAEFDVVYVTRYTALERYVGAIKRFAPQAKILFCLADLHFLRETREALAEQDLHKLEMAAHTRDRELAVMAQADAVLTYNDVEAGVLETWAPGRAKVVKAPWIVEPLAEPPGPEAREGVIFLGGFTHKPNRTAVEDFTATVWPQVRQAVPEAVFRVYGAGADQALKGLAAQGVEVPGYVEDIAEAYDAARVFVAPLLAGAGVKGKVVEALARGVPSVLSPIAAEGIPITPGVHAFIAATPDEWIAAVRTLMRDDAVWAAMSLAARDLAQTVYNFNAGLAKMRRAVEAAGIHPPMDVDGLRVRSARP